MENLVVKPNQIQSCLMKKILPILASVLLISCTKPKVFILNDTAPGKYSITDFVNKAFKRNEIGKSPLIVINGNSFRYNKELDTILLPLKKSDIINIEFLNINSSRIIYNEKENDGAIIITTKKPVSNQ